MVLLADAGLHRSKDGLRPGRHRRKRALMALNLLIGFESRDLMPILRNSTAIALFVSPWDVRLSNSLSTNEDRM